MSIEAIKELHYITPLPNLESIFDKGILSHNEAAIYKKADVSLDGVQEIRSIKVIPHNLMGQPKKIHDCTNVYFNAKNPMLSLRRKEKDSLCVLRLKPALLEDPSAVVSDRNAAVKDAKFYKAAEGINKLAYPVLFGKFWTSQYQPKETNEANKQIRCAEVLLPHCIHPSYIGGMYVASQAVKQAVLEKFPKEQFPDGCPVPISVCPSFFFDDTKVDENPHALSNSLYPTPIRPEELKVQEAKGIVVEADITVSTANTPQTIQSSTDNPKTLAPVLAKDGKEIEVIDLTLHEPHSTITKVELAKEKILPTAKTHASPKKIGALDNWLLSKEVNEDGVQKTLAQTVDTLQIPLNITLHKGNLLLSNRQTLTNTINCKGVMGAGIAKQFKERFPQMYSDYQKRCKANTLHPGVPYIFKTTEGKIVLNFPTKDHWNKDSQLPWISKGLKHIKANYKSWGITSLAMPPLGCGNGGLRWQQVRKMIIEILGDIDIPIDIYEPAN